MVTESLSGWKRMWSSVYWQMFNNKLFGRLKKTQVLTDSVCQFLCYKYSYHGRFQTTNMMSLNVELEMSTRGSRGIANQLMCVRRELVRYWSDHLLEQQVLSKYLFRSWMGWSPQVGNGKKGYKEVGCCPWDQESGECYNGFTISLPGFQISHWSNGRKELDALSKSFYNSMM